MAAAAFQWICSTLEVLSGSDSVQAARELSRIGIMEHLAQWPRPQNLPDSCNASAQTPLSEEGALSCQSSLESPLIAESWCVHAKIHG